MNAFRREIAMDDLATCFKLMWYLFVFAVVVWVTAFGLMFAGFLLIYLIKSRRLRHWFLQFFDDANPLSLMLPSIVCAAVLWTASVSTGLIVQYDVYNHPAGFNQIDYGVLTQQGLKIRDHSVVCVGRKPNV
jgi:hypothetical protein